MFLQIFIKNWGNLNTKIEVAELFYFIWYSCSAVVASKVIFVVNAKLKHAILDLFYAASGKFTHFLY